MDIERFSALSVAKKVWLGLNYVCEPSRLRSAMIKIVGFAVLVVAGCVLHALVVGQLGTLDRHQVKWGSPEEKVITAYMNVIRFDSNRSEESYEHYEKADRERKLDSTWVPDYTLKKWLDAESTGNVKAEMRKNKTWNDPDTKKAGYYEQAAIEWGRYKNQLRNAAGPAQECSIRGSIVASLPWETPSNQPGSCQAMSQKNVLYKTSSALTILVVFLVPILCLIDVLCIFPVIKLPAWSISNAIADYPKNQMQAFEAWLINRGDKSLSHLERHQFALTIWKPRKKARSILNKHGAKRL